MKTADEVVAPDQIVALLLKTDTFGMNGFSGAMTELPFWVPAVSAFDPQAVTPLHKRSAFVGNIVVGVAAAAVVATVAALAYWYGSLSGGAAREAVTPLTYSVKSVSPNGLMIILGSEQLSIPVGSLLPSGEILRSVDLQRQSYSTDTQITVVKK